MRRLRSFRSLPFLMITLFQAGAQTSPTNSQGLHTGTDRNGLAGAPVIYPKEVVCKTTEQAFVREHTLGERERLSWFITAHDDLAFMTAGSTIKIVDVKTGKELDLPHGSMDPFITPDGRYLTLPQIYLARFPEYAEKIGATAQAPEQPAVRPHVPATIFPEANPSHFLDLKDLYQRDSDQYSDDMGDTQNTPFHQFAQNWWDMESFLKSISEGDDRASLPNLRHWSILTTRADAGLSSLIKAYEKAVAKFPTNDSPYEKTIVAARKIQGLIREKLSRTPDQRPSPHFGIKKRSSFSRTSTLS